MDGAGIAVVIATVAALAGLGWFFFAPRRAHAAELAGGVQRVTVTVKGGYAPDVIRAQPGIPLELVFDRQESGDCTSRVVFPDLAMSAALPAYEQTTVRLAAPAAGSFGFACGMNMIHGTLIVDPDGAAAPAGELTAERARPCPQVRARRAPGLRCTARRGAGRRREDAEAAERRAEISRPDPPAGRGRRC